MKDIIWKFFSSGYQNGREEFDQDTKDVNWSNIIHVYGLLNDLPKNKINTAKSAVVNFINKRFAEIINVEICKIEKFWRKIGNALDGVEPEIKKNAVWLVCLIINEILSENKNGTINLNSDMWLYFWGNIFIMDNRQVEINNMSDEMKNIWNRKANSLLKKEKLAFLYELIVNYKEYCVKPKELSERGTIGIEELRKSLCESRDYRDYSEIGDSFLDHNTNTALGL